MEIIPIYGDNSPILVEETIEINIGNDEIPKIVLFVESLIDTKLPKFCALFTSRQVNFTCSYANISRLDPKLVLHHIPLNLDAKPIKQKLRKMHLCIHRLLYWSRLN